MEVKQTGDGTFQIGRVAFDKIRRTVTIPAKVRMRNEVVEYGLVAEYGKGYESIFTTEAQPSDVHLAFLLLGVSAMPMKGEERHPVAVPEANAVRVEVSWEKEGQLMRVPLRSLIQLTSGKPDPEAPAMETEKWFYSGSVMKTNGFAAQREGSIIALITDATALVNNPAADRDNDDIHFPNIRLLPPEQTPVQVIISLPQRGSSTNALRGAGFQPAVSPTSQPADH